MTIADKMLFIENDLSHELRCLLGAATIWKALKEADAGFDVVIAMDSAFVHARCLFNFFTSRGSNDISIVGFGPPLYDSPIYEKWKEALHRHVLHVAKGRAVPTNLIDGAHLKNQVLAFAHEGLRLWRCFEADAAASKYADILKRAEVQALADARNDAGKRTTPPFA
ncbi:MAG: hypothetical protein U1F44_03665 [Coriobacteriia bacterium]|nr:hypothetical protein [Coriobacteriia bacterium]